MTALVGMIAVVAGLAAVVFGLRAAAADSARKQLTGRSGDGLLLEGLGELAHWKQEGARLEAQRLFDAKEFVKGIEIDDEILKEHIYFLDNKNLGKSEYNCLRTLRKQYRQAIENEYIQSRDRVLNQFYSYRVPNC